MSNAPRDHHGLGPAAAPSSPAASLTRRTVVRAGLLGAGAIAAGAWPVRRASAAPVTHPLVFGSPALAPFVDELPRLPVVPAAGGSWPPPGRTGSPAICRARRPGGTAASTTSARCSRAHRDAAVDLLVENRLGPHPMARHLDLTLEGSTADDIARPRTITHLHGGLTEPASDGHPLQGGRPLSVRPHHYGNRQQAAGLWYHDHAMGITRLGVYAGLAGAYCCATTSTPRPARQSARAPGGRLRAPAGDPGQDLHGRWHARLPPRSLRARGQLGGRPGVTWPWSTASPGRGRRWRAGSIAFAC